MFESEREIEGRGGVFGSWLTTGTERRVLPFDVRWGSAVTLPHYKL